MTAKSQAKGKKKKTGKSKVAAKPEAKDNNSTNEAKKQKFEVEFYRDWCKGCGICAAFCPAEALSLNEKGEPELNKPELCTGCTWCELRCPDFAVRAKAKEEEKVCEA